MNNFLKDEIREGFYVPSMVKKAWSAELKVLIEVDRICKKNNIPYYAEWGTLLGAVRHGGFIPWDDDLDISMRRRDFERFKEIAAKELPKDFKFYGYWNREGFRQFNARVVAMDRICFEEDHLRKYDGFPYIAGLDIFVLDYVDKDEERWQERRKKASEYLTFSDNLFYKTLGNTEKKNLLLKYEKEIGLDIKNPESWDVQEKLFEMTEETMSSCPENEARGLIQMVPCGIDHNQVYSLSWYEKTVDMPFENITVPVPVGYDELLHKKYGDYMKVVREGGGHNYPFFEAQKAELMKVKGYFSTDYSFKQEDILEKSHKDEENIKYFASECLKEINRLIEGVVSSELQEERIEILSGLQQQLIDFGTLVELVDGENSETVKMLERFCEDIFFCSQTPEENKVSTVLLNDFERLFEVTKREIIDKRRVVFLLTEASGYESFRPFVEKEINTPDTDVVISFVPYGIHNFDGTITDFIVDNSLSESGNCGNITLTDYTKLNLNLRGCDVIYIDFPFDREHTYLSVHPSFYTEELKKVTDKLVYIQTLIPDDFTVSNGRAVKNMKYYVTIPGIIRCDEVYVSTGVLRERYIEALTSFAGEDTKSHWEQIIFAVPERKKNAVFESSKKRLCYYVDICSLLLLEEKALEKISANIEVFSGMCDKLSYVWYIPKNSIDVLRSENPGLYSGLSNLMERFETECHGILEKEISPKEMSERLDAFYGDAGVLANYSRNINKPVMIANYNI